MNIHEYQAKAILREFGVPVPDGHVCYNSAGAREWAKRLGEGPWVVKAQIHAGGRGKAGGVKLCRSEDEVADAADELLGKKLVVKVATATQISELLKRTEQSQRVLEQASESFKIQIIRDDENGDEVLSIDKIQADTAKALQDPEVKAALAKIDTFMRNGGTILFDTRDHAGLDLERGLSARDLHRRRLAEEIGQRVEQPQHHGNGDENVGPEGVAVHLGPMQRGGLRPGASPRQFVIRST